MKKIFLFVFLIFSFSGIVFSDEEDLGKVDLTPRQMARLSILHSSTVRGFMGSEGYFTAFTTRHLSKQERLDLVDSMKSLPDTPLAPEADKIDFHSSPFKGLSPQQAEDWIEANVTTTSPSAKEAMKKMARALAVLLRRSDVSL